METTKLSIIVADGTVHYPDHDKRVADLEWAKHPKFKGVFLKHMILGTETAGLFSAHLVRIDPGCRLEHHSHDGQWELHEVIEGAGICGLMTKRIDYAAGKTAVIPQGQDHWVEAGEDGLVLLAKFFPALI